MNNHEIRIFALNSAQNYAKKVLNCLKREFGTRNLEISPHKEEWFRDGEPKLQAQENVRGCDVFVIASLYSDDNESIQDKFVKLLFFIDLLKDASAERVTAVIPYLGYGRQDRKTESRAPIYTKYIAKYLKKAGCKRLLVMDVHNLSAEQNAYHFPIDILPFQYLFIKKLAQDLPKNLHDDIVFMSPDSGGLERLEHLQIDWVNYTKAQPSGDPTCYLHKKHGNRSKAIGDRLIGDVDGKMVLPFDDMIDSGGSMVLCDDAIQKAGGKIWGIAATHGLFTGEANTNLKRFERIYVSDTIPPFRLESDVQKQVITISTASLFARAIRMVHEHGSISELFSFEM